MALKGKKPTTVEKRLKMLMFGEAGVGKTWAGIQFPKPYLIDTEKGAENDQYVKMLNDSGGVIFQSNDPEEVIAEVTALMTEKHEYRTLVIDPLTTLYNDLLDRAALEVGTDFGRHKGLADRPIKRLLNLLVRLDMNVVITSHAKPNWARTKDSRGKDTVVQDGMTFDCYGRLDYLFDLVIHLQRRGEKRIGTVRKTRIDSLPMDSEINPWSYAEFAKLYGGDILERQAVPQQLASAEQITTLSKLTKNLNIPEETQSKWLDKAQATVWDEMPADVMDKCIEWCKKQVEEA